MLRHDCQQLERAVVQQALKQLAPQPAPVVPARACNQYVLALLSAQSQAASECRGSNSCGRFWLGLRGRLLVASSCVERLLERCKACMTGTLKKRMPHSATMDNTFEGMRAHRQRARSRAARAGCAGT